MSRPPSLPEFFLPFSPHLKGELPFFVKNVIIMTLEELTKFFDDHAHKMADIDKTMKLVLDEGIIYVEMKGENSVVTNEDKEADCVITTKTETLQALREGKLNPMMAVMGGKIKIKGDMGVAMKLQSLLSD